MKVNKRIDLVQLLRELNLPMTAAEVGCAEGRLSKDFVDAGIEQLYLVDLFESMPFLSGCASFDDKWHEENYKKVCDLFENDNRVIILKGFSHKVAQYVPDKSLGLVYIDASHDYQSVKSDISIWWDKLCEGGVLSGHDYGNPAYGVSRAIIEFMEGEDKINVIQEDGNPENFSFWCIKKSA